MPKITDKQFTIAGNNIKYGIWYTESDKFFIKEFDQQVVGDEYRWKKFGAGTETMEDLIDKAHQIITEYEEKISTLKKVIVLNLTASKSHLERYAAENRRYNESQYEPKWISYIHSSDVYDGAVMGFYIEFKVKMFRKTGDQHEFYDISGTGKLMNRNLVSNLTMHQIIDWTQEREDALNKLHSMFDSLLDKFVNAMKTPEKFIESINSQKLLT